MHPSLDQLPRALREVSLTLGLEFLNHPSLEVSPLPIACAAMPIFDDPVKAINEMPVAYNFYRQVLDMDNPEDVTEYRLIMDYVYGGHGGRIVYLQRVFVRKVKTPENGKIKRRKIQRIFVEYIAPYKVPKS